MSLDNPQPRKKTRRRSDRLRRYNLFDRAWLLAISVVVVIAINNSSDATNAAKHAASKAKDAASGAQSATNAVIAGRHTALAVTCAVSNAFSAAGREVITSSANVPETPFTKVLERLGYPGPQERAIQAKAASDAYAQTIARNVQRQIGGKLHRVITSTGTIDCPKLELIAHAS